MRQIKFRAWNPGTKKMIDLQSVTPLAVVAELSERPGLYLPFDERYVLMQFTGLTDKNGKEIYEGDIVERWEMDYDSKEFEKWKESGYDGDEPAHSISIKEVVELSFRYWLKGESFGYEGEDLQDPEQYVIIGNIYEHPDLITRINPTT